LQTVQACGAPARDIFTRSSRLVSSVVVVPLVAGDEPPLGGLYFALDTPCEFVNIQDTLLVRLGAFVPFKGFMAPTHAQEPASEFRLGCPRVCMQSRNLWVCVPLRVHPSRKGVYTVPACRGGLLLPEP
jgi:hypothetical protein